MRRADCLLDRREGGGVRDARAGGVAGGEALCFQAPIDPRLCSEHDHEVDAQTPKKREIVHDAVKPRIGGRFTVDFEYEGPSAVRIDVRRGPTEPFDEADGASWRCRIVHRFVQICLG